jgi:hypothetical protein
MNSGMRIWGPTGALELDENSFTVRVVYSALVTSSGRNIYIPIAGVSPSTHTGICLPNVAWSNSNTAQSAYVSQFDAQILEGGVRVWFSNRNLATGRLGVGTQRLLVLRYR